MRSLSGDPSSGIAIGVIPHSPHWSVVTIEDKWTRCSAQEILLLLWLDPLPHAGGGVSALSGSASNPTTEVIPPLVRHDKTSDESDANSDSSDTDTEEDIAPPHSWVC